MKIIWKASFSASCLHAAACMNEKLPLADEQLTAAMGPAVYELVGEMRACRLSPELLLPRLAGMASEYENNRQLVEVCLDRLLGRGSVDSSSQNRLSGQIADLEAALRGYRPQIAEELSVRGRPLREQWESRGPGMLAQVARLTEGSFVADAAEVVLVAPLVGGHGLAHLNVNRVTFEAVLANPHDDLPEVVRLAWLLAQLNIDVPIYSEAIDSHSLPLVASLATIPPVLAAAETVDLLQYSPEMLARALRCWHCDLAICDDVADRLHGWWTTYRAGGVEWRIALAALGPLLESRQ